MKTAYFFNDYGTAFCFAALNSEGRKRFGGEIIFTRPCPEDVAVHVWKDKDGTLCFNGIKCWDEIIHASPNHAPPTPR